MKSCERLPPRQKAHKNMTKVTKRKSGTTIFPKNQKVVIKTKTKKFSNKCCATKKDLTGLISPLRKKTPPKNKRKVSKLDVPRNKTAMKDCKIRKLHSVKNQILASRQLKSSEKKNKKAGAKKDSKGWTHPPRKTSRMTSTKVQRLQTPKLKMTPITHSDRAVQKMPKNSASRQNKRAEIANLPRKNVRSRIKRIKAETQQQHLSTKENSVVDDPQEKPDLPTETKNEVKEQDVENEVEEIYPVIEQRNPCAVPGYVNLIDDHEDVPSTTTLDRNSPQHCCAVHSQGLPLHKDASGEDISDDSLDSIPTPGQYGSELDLAGTTLLGHQPECFFADEFNLQSTHEDTFPAHRRQQEENQNTSCSSDDAQAPGEQEEEAGDAEDGIYGVWVTDVLEDWVCQNRNNNTGLDDDDPARRKSSVLTPFQACVGQYDLLSFNASLLRLKEKLADAKYQKMDGDFPTADLKRLVSALETGLVEYKYQVEATFTMLLDLAKVLQHLRTSLCEHVTHTLSAEKIDKLQQNIASQEELEGQAKASELTVLVAEAHSHVSQAFQIATQAQAMAHQHKVTARQTAIEAHRLQMELARKAEEQRKEREEEARRQAEEERRKKEEEEKREREQRLAEEVKWKRQQESLSKGSRGSESMNEMESWLEWPCLIYPDGAIKDGSKLVCIIQACPEHLTQADVTCEVISQYDLKVTYREQEELISKIVAVHVGNEDLEDSSEHYHIAIPCLGRLPATREPLIKVLREGEWKEVSTTEAHFEQFKDIRFAQAEVEDFSTFLVMSRLKHDYLTLPVMKRNMAFKVPSTIDPRVTLVLKKGVFKEPERVVLMVQSVDSTNISEFRKGNPDGRGLLATSPVIHTMWESSEFGRPLGMALPCPPNPAIAKRLALAKKKKEEKQNAVATTGFSAEEPSKASRKDHNETGAGSKTAANRMQTSTAGEPEDKPASRGVQSRWYMGQYGMSEDDENDQLCLMTYSLGKWNYASHVQVTQVCGDIVTFYLDEPCERLFVLRAALGVTEEKLKQMTLDLMDQLTQRSVYFIVKQQQEDPYHVCCHVVPNWNLERTLKTLKNEGFGEDSEAPRWATVREGDYFSLKLRGNLKLQNPDPSARMSFLYNSNLSTNAAFRVTEVDKYLQRNFDTYRGALQIERIFSECQSTWPKTSRRPSRSKDTVMCSFNIDIPKFHVEAEPATTRMTVKIPDSQAINGQFLHSLVDRLGPEWQDLALHLNLEKVRLQAILRLADGSEEQAKYDMLLTWFKRCPHAADKVTILANALQAVGRRSLANYVRSKKGEAVSNKNHLSL